MDLIYAIGDIHGELPLMEELLGEIAWDARGRSGGPHTIVFLGDYVDRGLHSRAVIERVRTGIEGFDTIALKGNHDQMLVDLVEDPSLDRAEKYNRDFVGGRETLASYGVDLTALVEDLRAGKDAAAHLDAVPEGHIAWIKSLPLTYEAPGYLFVHAGLRPGVPIENQEERDLIWIKEPFLSDPSDHGALVIHGHASRQTAELLPNRVNVDTGACLFGVLTAAVVDPAHPGTMPRLLQVKGERTAPFPSKELMAQRARERAEAAKAKGQQ